MFAPDQYELIDFGDGTKVERFGDKFIARESPSVERFIPARPVEEVEVDASFDDRDGGSPRWHGDVIDDCWSVRYGEVNFSLRLAPTGQVGLFPEQSKNWDWIAEHAAMIKDKKAINLFGYTGGSTLALAAAGASVTHVDAASSVVAWARKNAELSSLSDHPVRWIVEDALKFVRREIKRGNTYDIFVADPPSFGRGPKKETWKIERDLQLLIESARELCPKLTMGIVSCHTPSIRRSELASEMKQAFGAEGILESFELSIETADSRRLPSGDCVRFIAES